MELFIGLLTLGGLLYLLIRYRRARWILGSLVAILTVIGSGLYCYYEVWLNRPQRLDELWEVKLGWPRDEVIFRKGAPKRITHEDGEERLRYKNEYNSEEHVVIILDDRVVGVYVIGGWSSSIPFGLSGGIESIEERLGPPQTIRKSDSNLTRTLMYPQYNLYLILRENRITDWGIRAG